MPLAATGASRSARRIETTALSTVPQAAERASASTVRAVASLELIHARNFLAQISTPGFLVDQSGRLVYYNDASSRLLGVRYEEAGAMGPDEWGSRFGPFDEEGNQIPIERLPLTIAFQSGRPAHSRFRIRSDAGEQHEIAVTAFPIQGSGGRRGALAFFWPADTD